MGQKMKTTEQYLDAFRRFCHTHDFPRGWTNDPNNLLRARCIRDLRQLGISQVEIARAAGVRRQRIEQILQSKLTKRLP